MKLWSLLGNSQRLDGGAMFGNVPKAMWSKWLPPDADNRVPLACRGLLASPLNGKTVLFETGIGAFFEPKMRERYGVMEDRHLLLDALHDAGFSHEDVDVVVLSHLHFDHAGGLLAAWSAEHPPRLLFPNARFVIGAVISMTAVAYYVTPFEAVTKILVIPGAVLGVLFPAFAASHRQDPARMVHLYARGIKYIGLMLFPVMLLMTGFAHEGLNLWMGSEFAGHSAPVLQILAIGVFVNGCALVFATLVQGVGRPDLGAKLHLLQLPIYFVGLWWAIDSFGILGAATAWSVRVSVNGALLFWVASRFLGENDALIRRLIAGLLAAVAGLVLPLLASSPAHRGVLVLVVFVAFVSVAWFRVLDHGERSMIQGGLARVVARGM
ncbi:MAG: hypothetical protein CVV17_01680 [Gammaproteobacteria bacterium HGW-Gammaproteobacteria-7]|nr:MAG: hypothetical protein CVV17_01680 [Gammaproteobacteria bacterium HGW-Gammaproteobacteria-7]